MAGQTTRLQLPTDHYRGAGASGVISRIAAGVFTTADARLMQSGAGSPQGSVTSQWAGQPYLDTSNGDMYFATITSSAHHWVRYQPGELVAHEGAVVCHEGEAVVY